MVEENKFHPMDCWELVNEIRGCEEVDSMLGEIN